ncbi:MAG TPA: DUF1329 domain-containing protein [Candidatus Binataceae bacterium]|jgi:hypothetical protein|nr:DUF1329 domain-containing protein [Candidatus Binataceae bacterium]
MRVIRDLVLIIVGLVWLCWSGIAAAQVSWSQPSYDSLAPADSSKTIPPGTRINAQNWQQYKDFMPVGMQGLWAGKFFWHLPDKAEMVVGATTPTPPPKKYQEDTEKYASQVTLVKNSESGYDIKGYVAGAPFPKPSGPDAGVQIMYNEYYAYIPYLITTYASLGFNMDKFGNKYQTGVREVNFKVKHLSDPGKPINIPNNSDFLTQNNVIMEPEQSKYVNALQIFHDDPAELPDSYVFVPSLRRSIRLTTAARCSPLVGSDYTQDDERSMNLQPPIFQSRFLGYKNILVGYPAAGYTKVDNYYKPLYFPGPAAVTWQVRPVAVLDIRRVPAKTGGYCYGSRMAFIDRETWQPIWMDLYDAELHLWKTGPSIYRPMPIPGTNGDVSTGAGGPGDGDYTFWDVQNNHITLDIQNDGLINDDAKRYDDYNRWGTPGGMSEVMQ